MTRRTLATGLILTGGLGAACATTSSLNETHGAWFSTYLINSPQQTNAGRDVDPFTGEAAATAVRKYYTDMGAPPLGSSTGGAAGGVAAGSIVSAPQKAK